MFQYKKLFFPRRDRESRQHRHGEKREHRCRERRIRGRQQHRWEKKQEKESLSAEGSQAEAQGSPVINLSMSSLSSGTLGAGRAQCLWLCPPFWEELWSRLDCLQTLLELLRGNCVQSGEKQYNGLTLPSFLPKPHWNSLCSCSRAWLLPGEQRPTDPVRPNSTDPDIPDLPVESQTSSPSWYVQVYSGSYWTDFVLEFIPSHLPGMPSLIIHSFRWYLLNTYNVSDSVLGAENRLD